MTWMVSELVMCMPTMSAEPAHDDKKEAEPIARDANKVNVILFFIVF